MGDDFRAFRMIIDTNAFASLTTRAQRCARRRRRPPHDISIYTSHGPFAMAIIVDADYRLGFIHAAWRIARTRWAYTKRFPFDSSIMRARAIFAASLMAQIPLAENDCIEGAAICLLKMPDFGRMSNATHSRFLSFSASLSAFSAILPAFDTLDGILSCAAASFMMMATTTGWRAEIP